MPSKQADRAGDTNVLTWRGTIITALAAVMAAIIGLGSALITGNYEDDRARTDSIREQRQVVYAEYLSSAMTVGEMVDLYRSDPTQEEVEAVLAAVNAMHGQLQEVALTARVPTHIAASALYIRVRAHAAHEIYASFCSAHPDVDATACDYVELDGGTAPVPEDAFNQAHDDFIREARKDLQVEDWDE